MTSRLVKLALGYLSFSKLIHIIKAINVNKNDGIKNSEVFVRYLITIERWRNG